MHRSRTAIETSLKVVNLVGILDQKHGSTTVVVNGRKEKRCPIVPAMTCEEHFKIADYAFLNGFPSSNGQVFVCVFNSQGKRPGKAYGNPGAEGYVQIVEEALKKIDGASFIHKLDYDAFMLRMEAVKAARAKKDTRKAIDLLEKAAKHEIQRLGHLAQDGLREINEEGMMIVADAQSIASESLAKAKDKLKHVIAKYGTLECSKEAEKVLKRLMEQGK